MNSRKSESIDVTREEVREIAESLALFRSAMHHVADHEASRLAPATRPAHLRSPRLFLHPAIVGPVLATAIFLASLPLWLHPRHEPHAAVETAVSVHTSQPHRIPDAELLSQIDAEVSEEVPDALQPMADLGSAASATSTSSSARENQNATQE
ncbi:hypothetical protein [Paracidobacterium acidisoli]|uniref:hypothetical protein n=1 Tax=Paracidobacterium acidisoli TaxID=2303751 RepID=UPI001314BF6C|nr:hypothetical protein [Paracidobacterium acidisoli]MBT9330922.1 hypothetical protein [Paracidobacterium acidisoli]